MKYNCDLIKDLLPLYVDEICSDESKKIVEEHLDECLDCRDYLNKLKKSVMIEENSNDGEEKTEILKKFKNKIIKRNITIALLNILIIILILFGTYKYLENTDVQIKSDNINSIMLVDDNLIMNFNKVYKTVSQNRFTLEENGVKYECLVVSADTTKLYNLLNLTNAQSSHVLIYNVNNDNDVDRVYYYEDELPSFDSISTNDPIYSKLIEVYKK